MIPSISDIPPASPVWLSANYVALPNLGRLRQFLRAEFPGQIARNTFSTNDAQLDSIPRAGFHNLSKQSSRWRVHESQDPGFNLRLKLEPGSGFQAESDGSTPGRHSQ
jgi:hypothetical protein